MASYATYEQFTAVYSVKGVSEAEINSAWLPHGTLRVNEALGGYYTTPFSSNNWTARDLCIQYAYLGILVRTRNPDDSKELLKQIMIRVTDITSGGKPMVMDDGANTILPDKNNQSESWSTTMDYKPAFDMRNAMDQRIDPDRLSDEWDEDY